MEEVVPVKPSTRSLRRGFSREYAETNKRIEDLQAIITARSLNKQKLLGTKLHSSKPAQVHSDGNQRNVTQTMHNDNGDAGGGGGGGGGCSDDGQTTVTQLGEEVATVETAPDTDQTWERRGTFFVFPQGQRFDPWSCSNRDDASPQETGDDGDDGDDEDGGGGDGWARASVDDDEVEASTPEMERTKERRRTLLTLTQAPEPGFRSANWEPRVNVVRLVAAMPTIDSSPTLSEHCSQQEAEGPADPPWLANSTPSSERLGHEDDDSREEVERFPSEPTELPNNMGLHLSASEASDDMELAHCPDPATPKEIPRVEGGGEPAVPPRNPTWRGGASSGDDGADAPGKLSPPEEVVSRSESLLPSLSETLDDAELAHYPGLATPKGIPRAPGGDPVLPDDPTRHAAASSGNGVVDGALVVGGEEEEVIVCTSQAPLPSPSDDSSESRSPVAVGKAHKRKLDEGGDPLADRPVVTREGADTAEVKAAGPKHRRRQTDKPRGGEHGTTAQPAQRRKWGARVPPAATTSQQSGGAAPVLGKPRAKRAATTSTLRVTRTLTLQQEAAVTAAPTTSPTAASTTAAAPAANAAILAAATTAATSPTVAASTSTVAPTTADSPADIVATAAAADVAVPGAAAVGKVEAAKPLKEKTPETAMREGSQRKTRASATGKDLSGLTGKSSSTTTARSQKKAATEGKAMAKGKAKPRGRGAAQGELEKETTEASGQPENLGICTPPLPPAPPPTPTDIDSPLEGAGAEKTPERRQRSLRARGPQASVKALSPSPGPKPTRRLRSKALSTITEGETHKGQEKATGGKGKAVATAAAAAVAKGTAEAEGKAEGKRTTRVAQRELKNEAESVQPKTRRIRAPPASSPSTPSESDPPEAAAAGTEKKTPQRRQRSLRSQGPETSVKALSPSPGPKPTLRQRSKALATITDGETLKTDAADGKPNLKKRMGLAPGKGK